MYIIINTHIGAIKVGVAKKFYPKLSAHIEIKIRTLFTNYYVQVDLTIKLGWYLYFYIKNEKKKREHL